MEKIFEGVEVGGPVVSFLGGAGVYIDSFLRTSDPQEGLHGIMVFVFGIIASELLAIGIRNRADSLLKKGK